MSRPPPPPPERHSVPLSTVLVSLPPVAPPPVSPPVIPAVSADSSQDPVHHFTLPTATGEAAAFRRPSLEGSDSAYAVVIAGQLRTWWLVGPAIDAQVVRPIGAVVFAHVWSARTADRRLMERIARVHPTAAAAAAQMWSGDVMRLLVANSSYADPGGHLVFPTHRPMLYSMRVAAGLLAAFEAARAAAATPVAACPLAGAAGGAAARGQFAVVVRVRPDLGVYSAFAPHMYGDGVLYLPRGEAARAGAPGGVEFEAEKNVAQIHDIVGYGRRAVMWGYLTAYDRLGGGLLAREVAQRANPDGVVNNEALVARSVRESGASRLQWVRSLVWDVSVLPCSWEPWKLGPYLRSLRVRRWCEAAELRCRVALDPDVGCDMPGWATHT